MRLFLWIVLTAFAASCRHASLMEQDPDPKNLAAAEALLKAWKPKFPSCDKGFEAFGDDIWHSRFLRWLTPLQQAKNHFTLYDAREGTEFLLDQNRRFRLPDSELSTLDRIYFESLRLYILLPQLLADVQNATLLGQISLGKEQYTAIFFNLKAGFWNDPQLDQYVAYFEDRQHRLELIQFTYRDLTQTYVGWLRFGPTKNFEAFPYPSRISILDSWDSKQSTHEIHLRQLRCGERR